MTFDKLLRQRYSLRDYTTTPVEKENIEKILEAGTMAPSAANKQPWRFYVITEEKSLKKIKAAYERPWINNVQCFIAIVGLKEKSWVRPADQKNHTYVDCAIAIDHMTLQATELGLGTCWICNFDIPKTKELLNLNEQEEPIALLSVGYPNVSDTEIIKKRNTVEENTVWL